LPYEYVSGDGLSDTMTFDNATFATLGVTPGTYKWTWGAVPGVATGDDSFTLQVGVPEPSTWAMMALGFGGLGLAAFRRSAKQRLAAA
jgi:hypothetical protein